MKIIAIETSHDDTSVVVYENKKIIKEYSSSQTKFHKKFGGTVPEYASRHHFDKLREIVDSLIEENMLSNVDHIAYTATPGLIGSLHMGKLFAFALGYHLGISVKPINHMYGHIFAVAFTNEISFPALALIVSGGHTQIWNVRSVNDISLLGETKDDAVGEVYDKIARRLGIGFPGGPIIDKLSKKGKVNIDFSLHDDGSLNFSFSGLKTKVINYINNIEQKGGDVPTNDICASFQKGIVDILIKKMEHAISIINPKSIILGGGVSANSELRERFSKIHQNPLVPAMQYTTDNAMMIAIRSHIKEKYE